MSSPSQQERHQIDPRPGCLHRFGFAFVALGIAGFVATAAMAVAAAMILAEGDPNLPEGDEALEGRITTAETVLGPVGAPIVYGHVTFECIADAQHRNLWVGTVGRRQIQLESSGERMIGLPDPHTALRGRLREQATLASLDDVPMAERAVGWREARCDTFVVSTLGVRPHEHLILRMSSPTEASEMWVGRREEIRAQSGQHRMVGLFIYAGVAGLFAIFSMIFLVLGVVGIILSYRKRSAVRS